MVHHPTKGGSSSGSASGMDIVVKPRRWKLKRMPQPVVRSPRQWQRWHQAHRAAFRPLEFSKWKKEMTDVLSVVLGRDMALEVIKRC